MICKRCKREIADGAMFCTQCGANQYEVQKTEDNSISYVLLLIFVVLDVVLGFTNVLIHELVPEWWDSVWRYISRTLYIISNLSLILIPLAIKKQSFKIIGLILMIPWILYLLYINISNMF
ncbi:MAG: zinc ribbon domain-containing protein [Muribaculaceae bacterium]|nr:zinc ribbon domain-containing protein [Muribaculaceae bacterium]